MEKTFGFEQPPQEGARYLIFAPLSADYLEAYTLNLYYQRAYALRNVEAERANMPDRLAVIPQVEVIPVAFSRDFQRVAYPQIALTGNEIAMPYLDITEWGDTLRATQQVIAHINPNMLTPQYRQFHGL